MKKFKILIPLYNDWKSVSKLLNEIDTQTNNWNAEVSVIIVNDASTEEKSNLYSNYKKIKSVKILNMKKNTVHQRCIAAGLKSAEGEYIGWAHADLQTPLADFYKLYMLVKSEKRIFGKGNRTNNRGYDGVISRFHEVCASLILGQKMREINAQPKIFHKSMLGLFTNIPTQWTTLDTYVFYICLINRIKIIEMDVIFKTRIYGQSKWKNNFVNFIKHLFFNIIYLIKLRFSK